MGVKFIKKPIMHYIFLWIFILGFTNQVQILDSDATSTEAIQFSEFQEESDTTYFKNKIIPEELLIPVMEALSFFPDLEDVDISFVFRENIGGSIMQAQPKVFSLFLNSKEERKYKVKITRNLVLGDEIIPIEEVPHDALVGWIGHELGHIMDYLDRSSANMMRFGMKYMLSQKSLTEAELTADGYAIGCGMGHHILANKNYILNNDFFEDSYKDKIRTLYMSPSQILSIQELLGSE